MRIAIVGCGYVADFYMKTLPLHPQLDLVAVHDLDHQRLGAFANHHRVRAASNLDDILGDDSIELVLNLTNPSSHYSISRACLLSGKHVYSEKPLGLSMEEARDLVSTAEGRGLRIASAPSRVLAETAQTMLKALRDGAIGDVWLAYAELDDGLLHRMPFQSWVSESGARWPFEDELETGCTIEHAGYALTWLLAAFGPATNVTAFSSCLVQDKHIPGVANPTAPDFSVACIRFAGGQVARMTNSIVAPRNHGICFIGETGVLYTGDAWRPRSPVYLRRRLSVRRRTILSPWRRRIQLPSGSTVPKRVRGFKKVDYLLGVAELANSVHEGRSCRLSHGFCLHTTEITLAVQGALDTGATLSPSSTFEPIEPMPWAS